MFIETLRLTHRSDLLCYIQTKKSNLSKIKQHFVRNSLCVIGLLYIVI